MATGDHDHDHGHDHGAEVALARIRALHSEGVHRAGAHEGPFSLHVVGLGRTGAAVLAQLVEDRAAGTHGDHQADFTALAVDIGEQDLLRVREAAGRLAPGLGEVRAVALPRPTRDSLLGSLNRYREFLKMEYPRYYWNPNYEPWLPSDIEIPESGHFPRALAKAVYGSEYYQDREVTRALEEFADRVLAAEATPIVCVVFAMAGGAGSGIVVELARHLSSIKLGRRPWVVGIGVMPCQGDPDGTMDGSLFPVINELDCMIDTDKNKGVMAVWGDLYKNPFTGGFFLVDQDEVFALTHDLAATHRYLDAGLASFLARDGSVHLYETLKMLNWLGVPGETWHPAIRGEQGERWVNMLTTRRPEDVSSLGALGLKEKFHTDYVEARVFAPKKAFGPKAEAALCERLAGAVQTPLAPSVLRFETEERPAVSVCLPRAAKVDLEVFARARDIYDTLTWDEKLLMHSWLLDLGVMLCEPSIRFDGMGGECIWGCACWVVVPHAAIRGEAAPTAPAPAQAQAAPVGARS